MTGLILLFAVVCLGIGVGIFWLFDHGHKNAASAAATGAGIVLGLITWLGPFWPPFIGAIVLLTYAAVVPLVRWILDKRRARKPAQTE